MLDEKRAITRRELDRMADTIALLLPVDAKRVGIAMENSVGMIASIFAVFCMFIQHSGRFPFYIKLKTIKLGTEQILNLLST